MSEIHTNTTADTDKYILNGVEVTPNEFIDIVTNFLEAQQSHLRRRDARIAELEAFKKIVNDCGFDVVTDAAILEYPERKVLTGHGTIYVPVEGA